MFMAALLLREKVPRKPFEVPSTTSPRRFVVFTNSVPPVRL